MNGREYVAKFPVMASAVRFAEAMRNPGNWAVNVVQKGRTVTWTSAIPADTDTTETDYLCDAVERAGYFGSTQARRATVNGIPCRMVW